MVSGAKRRASLWLCGKSIRGHVAARITTIKVTCYDVVGPGGQLAPFETFTLRRPRRDWRPVRAYGSAHLALRSTAPCTLRPHPGATAVFVDEFDAENSTLARSNAI